MTVFMNSSQEETFQKIVNYFTEKDYKISVSNSPSLVRAEFGSWISSTISFSLSEHTAKGDVEATIARRNGGSDVNFRLDFTKEYVAGLIVAVLGALFVAVIGYSYVSLAGLHFSSRGWTIVQVIFFVMASICFIIIMAVERYYIASTRKRLVEEFNMFTQSL